VGGGPARRSQRLAAAEPKEVTVPPDPPLDELLLSPPEWDIDWDDLLLPLELPAARSAWYSDWDEQE